jgi:hypothetical protein
MVKMVLRLVLTADAELEQIECDRCGEPIVTPYGMRASDKGDYICSTCAMAAAQEYKEEKLAEAHKPEAEFVETDPCPFCPEPAKCNGKCWHDFLVVVPKKGKKSNPDQGRLFNG